VIEAVDAHLETGIAKATRKCRFVIRRPDRQKSVRPEGGECSLQATVSVEPVVRFRDQGCRSVVDIEQDGVVRARLRADDVPDVPHHYRHPLVVERPSGQSAQWTAIPGHHRRHQLSHDDAALSAQAFQYGGKRISHSQSADEDARADTLSHELGGQHSQSIFRAVHPAVHQLVLPYANREFGTSLIESELPFISRYFRGIKQHPGKHRHLGSGPS